MSRTGDAGWTIDTTGGVQSAAALTVEAELLVEEVNEADENPGVPTAATVATMLTMARSAAIRFMSGKLLLGLQSGK